MRTSPPILGPGVSPAIRQALEDLYGQIAALEQRSGTADSVVTAAPKLKSILSVPMLGSAYGLAFEMACSANWQDGQVAGIDPTNPRACTVISDITDPTALGYFVGGGYTPNWATVLWWGYHPVAGIVRGPGGADAAACIRIDGTRPFTGNQAMGTHKITGLAVPTADGDAARLVDCKSYVSFGKSGALTVGMILSAHSIANSPFVAMRPGSVTGLTIQVNSSLSSTYAIAFQVYKNAGAGTLVVQRSDSNGTNYAVQATGIDTFVAGDTLDVRVVAPGGGKSHDVDANGVVSIMEITQAPTS